MNVAGKQNDTNPNDKKVFSPYKWPKTKWCDIHYRWYTIPSHFTALNETLTSRVLLMIKDTNHLKILSIGHLLWAEAIAFCRKKKDTRKSHENSVWTLLTARSTFFHNFLIWFHLFECFYFYFLSVSFLFNFLLKILTSNEKTTIYNAIAIADKCCTFYCFENENQTEQRFHILFAGKQWGAPFWTLLSRTLNPIKNYCCSFIQSYFTIVTERSTGFKFTI